MKVLVACEFSGVVRDAFLACGHDAMSCDLIPSERPGPHHVGDVRDILGDGWDLMIAHPPCTFLSRAGARYWSDPVRCLDMFAALKFALTLAAAPIQQICIENPIGKLNQYWRYPDQTVHPWQFGHGYTKATCLWLKGLPKLTPTRVVDGRVSWVMSKVRQAKERSRTFPGIAEAMAQQWGSV